MSKKTGKGGRSRQLLNPPLISRAMWRRVQERIGISGIIRIPAVPALLDEYVSMCAAVFAACGRALSAPERDRSRALISTALEEAFAGSPRSKIAIQYQAPPGAPLQYEVKPEVRTLAAAYENWIGTTNEPLFGSHPDARVLALAQDSPEPGACPVLDLGAGTGRNALGLARRGHPVDAVEITPKFADIIATEAARDGLSVRVLARDVFEDPSELRRDYGLFLLSEVVPDFRGTAQLRRVFELAARVLGDGGQLVFNVHLAAQGFTPDRAARQFAEQCYSALFTPSEVAQCTAGLPFELVSVDPVHDYEALHLPKEAWPPTPWYANWVLGLDVYDTVRDRSPVELVWVVYRKTGPRVSASTATLSGAGRPRRLDPAALRQALIRRLRRRALASGSFTFPAVPALADPYVQMCFGAFSALGRDVNREDHASGRELFARVLGQAFEGSARSNILVRFEAPMGSEVRYEVTAEAIPLSEAYEDWLEALPPPLFGEHADARVMSLVDELGAPASCRVLDLGAGTGRNALDLARRGHPVDAVEVTPKFAELIAAQAARQGLPIRVMARDVFACQSELRREYRLALLSGVVGDFRDTRQLRRVLELGDAVLVEGGLFVVSLHLARAGYTAEPAARQWAQQSCAMFFTRSELDQTLSGLGLELVSDESAYDYERLHLPEHVWPPTPSFPEWATGCHMYAIDRAQCPIELRWLVFRRASRR
ncbi:MAG: class I SAM-dependent methyltransferase [Polyangiaceae bacterium]|nr:class I SAM-dependent methyltransferase [Polyangiaceae bacterium]